VTKLHITYTQTIVRYLMIDKKQDIFNITTNWK